MKKYRLSLSVLFVVILLVACSSSIESEKVNAEEKTKVAFEKQSIQTNQSLQFIDFYLPSGIVVKEEMPNNIILDKGSHPYIVFYNPNEDSQSKVLYETAKKSAEHIVHEKTFTKDDQFGYLLINQAHEGLYEISVGIGGIKATTETKVNNLAEDAEMMMEIVSSAHIKS